jgi:hypothetical protein
MQPRPLLAGCELQVGFGPLAGPMILRPVESGRAKPVLPGEILRIAKTKSSLFW